MSKFTGGCIYHLPLFRASKLQNAETLERLLRRYLTRKIGFEAVMRLRCTRGLSIHAFHGSFFVRSTDLLCLPNINPDAGFGMQISIDENLSDVQNVCFQASLLYTSSKGNNICSFFFRAIFSHISYVIYLYLKVNEGLGYTLCVYQSWRVYQIFCILQISNA